jgi:hypothetical protein
VHTTISVVQMDTAPLLQVTSVWCVMVPVPSMRPLVSVRHSGCSRRCTPSAQLRRWTPPCCSRPPVWWMTVLGPLISPFMPRSGCASAQLHTCIPPCCSRPPVWLVYSAFGAWLLMLRRVLGWIRHQGGKRDQRGPVVGGTAGQLNQQGWSAKARQLLQAAPPG